MSENEEKSAEKLDVLFKKVYLPVFMDKLAARGIALKSDEDLSSALKIAAMTRVHVEAKAEVPSAIKQAANSLEVITAGNAGVIGTLLQDPEIVGALQG